MAGEILGGRGRLSAVRRSRVSMFPLFCECLQSSWAEIFLLCVCVCVCVWVGVWIHECSILL